MAEEHPKSEALQQFMRGHLSREERREIVRHLLGGCAHCVALTRSLWSLGDLGGGVPRPVTSLSPVPEAALLRGAEGPSLHRERRAAAARLVELYGLPSAARAARSEGDERFHLASLCQLLLNDLPRLPAGADRVANAELAATIARRLDPARYGAYRVAALLVRSWGQVASARRSGGDLPGAEQALATAQQYLASELRGAIEEGEILEIHALVLWDGARAAEAEGAMAGAVSIYRAAGGGRRLGRALVRHGILRSQLGDRRAPVAATLILKEGLEILNAEIDPRFAACALHWLGVLRAEAGAGSEALTLFNRARDLYREAGDLENRAGVWFAEGMLEAERGRTSEAERALLAAEQGFLEIGSGRGAAQALVQRTLFCVQQGHLEGMRSLGSQVLPILRCRDLSRGDAAALLLFRRLVESKQATEGFLAEVVRFLAGRRPVRRPAPDCAL